MKTRAAILLLIPVFAFAQAVRSPGIDGVELDGVYSCGHWCELSGEKIEIDGFSFTHSRWSDQICLEAGPCDPWSDGFPVSGTLTIENSEVTLHHAAYDDGHLVYRLVLDDRYQYLLNPAEVEKLAAGAPVRRMGLRKAH